MLVLVLAGAAMLFANAPAPKACAGACAGCERKAARNQAANAEAVFLAEARRMELLAEGRAICCRSTATRTIAKGEAGCCKAAQARRAFKVWVGGEFRFFACRGRAEAARRTLVAQGQRPGPVQRVVRQG